MAKGLIGTLNKAVSAPRANLTGWFGKTINLTDGDFWVQFLGNRSSSGKTVTIDRAMRLSAVWACVGLISRSVAGLPLSVYERQDDGGRKAARSLPIYDIVHTSPNDDMTAFQFWQAIVTSMLLWGNGYAEIKRIDNRIVALEFLLPSKMTLGTDDMGRLTYSYQPTKGPSRQIDRKDMLHIPAFSLDGRVGLSAISYGVDVFGAAMSADDAANHTFKNGMMPAVAFKVDRVLKKEQRDDFRQYVETVSGAMNAGKSPVLESGVTPETIGINPTDAQLLETRGHSIEEICRWFGVPPWMIGQTDKGSNWGTGLEQQMLAFLTFCISSITNPLQQAINKKILTPVERQRYYAEFSLEAFMRADSAGRAAFYSQMTQNGIYTRDDCREKENLPRKGGNAAVLTVQSNLTPLDKLGATQPSEAARAALMAWLSDPQTQE